MTDRLHAKLDPSRFPNMSGQIAASIGLPLDRPCTEPALAELIVTPDGSVLGRLEGEVAASIFIGAEANRRANLRRLGMAAGLDEAEWVEVADRVRLRPGMELGSRVGDRHGG